MIAALCRALGDLSSPQLRRVVLLSLALAMATMLLLWLGIGAVLYDTALFHSRLLNGIVELLGGVAVIVLSWLLFPAVVTLVMGFFLDRVAAAVESRHYPSAEAPRHPPFAETAVAMMRLMGLTILLNLLALPLYLMLPGINLFLFLAVNGYLLGREYFEVVALRRLDWGAARAARSRFGGRVFLGGVVIAGLFALPIVNLIAPVIATAFMVHVFEGLRRRAEPRIVARPVV
jgi:CysZ protein